MNFMADGIFCVKSFLLRWHAAAPCRSRHFERSEAESRNLPYRIVSCWDDRQRLHVGEEHNNTHRLLSEAMQPFYTTLGTEGQRPDGCHMPLCAAGAGPYGNTGKHHPLNPLNPGRRAALSPLLFSPHFCRIKKGIIFSGYPAPDGAFLLPAFPQKAHMRDKAG